MSLLVTLGGVTETCVCARLWFGSLTLQNVLHQLLDAKISRSERTLHTVDWETGRMCHTQPDTQRHTETLRSCSYTWASADSAGHPGSIWHCHGGQIPHTEVDCISQNPPGTAHSGSAPAQCLGSVGHIHTSCCSTGYGKNPALLRFDLRSQLNISFVLACCVIKS